MIFPDTCALFLLPSLEREISEIWVKHVSPSPFLGYSFIIVEHVRCFNYN